MLRFLFFFFFFGSGNAFAYSSHSMIVFPKFPSLLSLFILRHMAILIISDLCIRDQTTSTCCLL